MTETSGGAGDDNGPKWPGPGIIIIMNYDENKFLFIFLGGGVKIFCFVCNGNNFVFIFSMIQGCGLIFATTLWAHTQT